MTTPSPVPPHRRLYRNRDDRVVAGVAAGLAEHLRAPARIVRVVFILLLAANGFGALLYIAFWAVLPVRPTSNSATDVAPPRGRRRTQLAALGTLALGVIIAFTQLDFYTVDSLVVALAAVVALGAGIMWHQADPQRRRSAQASASSPPAPTPSDRRWFFVRVIGGGLIMTVGIVGILGFFSTRGPGGQHLSEILFGLLFALLALVGLVVAIAPILWRNVSQLREERVARIREQERAEVAAMVHDQVLHTLALIQRHAHDAASVARLARGQERSLRGWLYRPTGSPSERLAAALEQVAAEVEDAYGITVETVVVGDADHDERVAALVAATREALVNAARHAKVPTVSLYAEVERDSLTVFVRDRGVGFDLSTVDDDRHGVRGSIMGRMARHGGTAEVRSAPGEGTEVQLTIRIGAAAGPAAPAAPAAQAVPAIPAIQGGKERGDASSVPGR
jgi:signal transduction histidine kinase